MGGWGRSTSGRRGELRNLGYGSRESSGTNDSVSERLRLVQPFQKCAVSAILDAEKTKYQKEDRSSDHTPPKAKPVKGGVRNKWRDTGFWDVDFLFGIMQELLKAIISN